MSALSQAKPRTETAVKINRVLMSVSDKSGVEEFAKTLQSHGVEILSTGGTAKMLKDAGLDVTDVSDHTGFPEIMDGRVKTLHPTIHGGILARRDDADHQAAMSAHNISSIDMLVVNLYPFAETVKKGADFETCIENIDIGGPAMIRAAAKNHHDVTVITNPADYARVIEDMNANDGAVTYETRRKLALEAVSLTASYDSNISSWLSTQVATDDAFPARISFSGSIKQTLRYGENPHQSAALYMSDDNARIGAASATQLQGKELSYNNLNDTDAAFELVSEFDEPAVAIIKHANPCGVAHGKDIISAYTQALACDPVSAFGGIIALNRTLDAATATEIAKRFVEVVIAPDVAPDALQAFEKKKNIRILTTGTMPNPSDPRRSVTKIAGGLLVQDTDVGHVMPEDMKVVTDRAPTDAEMADMIFAFNVAKHVKSNAIIYAKNGATVGIGAGQMSRIDSARIAASKSMDAAKALGLDEPLAKGSVVASDAFFPFADGLITAAEAGVTAIIQPGGSIRDEEVIAAANERGLAMVMTGMRHFRH